MDIGGTENSVGRVKEGVWLMMGVGGAGDSEGRS